jgi:hypothetical protein
VRNGNVSTKTFFSGLVACLGLFLEEPLRLADRRFLESAAIFSAAVDDPAAASLAARLVDRLAARLTGCLTGWVVAMVHKLQQVTWK